MGETTASFWTDSELNQWIDDQIIDLNFKTRSLRKNALATPTVDTSEYSLIALFPDMLMPIQVYYNSNQGTQFIKLRQIKRETLDLDHPGWLSETSSTPNWYGWDKEEDWFLLWPPPDSNNVGTNYIRSYYVYSPSPITSDSAEPELNERLHELIIEGVKAVGFESRGLGDRANNSRTLYVNGITDYLSLKKFDEDEEIVMRNYRDGMGNAKYTTHRQS